MPSAIEIPCVVLGRKSSSCDDNNHEEKEVEVVKMPVIGMGSAPDFTCKSDTKEAILEAIKQGYRHFDTAFAYGSEAALGEAIKEALNLKLVSRKDLFVTSKLWCNDNHPNLVLPALQKSLR